MKVEIVPCLSDNYAYIVTDEASGKVAVVDPSEAAPVRAALAGRRPVALWCTHHHWDHVGGVVELVKELTAGGSDVEVVGHASDKGRIDGQTRFVEEGEELALG